MRRLIFAAALVLLYCVSYADAQADKGQAEFTFAGVRINIAPAFPEAARYAAAFAALTPSCDPYCIAAARAAENVETLIEPDVLEFMVTAVGRNEGLLVDARLPQDRAIGFIPGSVSLPHETLAGETDFRREILIALGARAFGDVLNFSDAQQLVVFDDGPTQNDANLLIAHLLEAGYPPAKLRYYRGGMQVWSVLGLTVQE